MRTTHIRRGTALTGLVVAALTVTLLSTPVTARAEVPTRPVAGDTVSHTNELSAAVTKLMKGTGVKAEATALEAYWTPARMRAAKSTDDDPAMNQAGTAPAQAQGPQTQPEGTPGSVPPAIKTKPPAPSATRSGTSAVTPQASEPNLPYDSPAARTNGKLFFTRAGLNYVCSGSIVNSEGKSLVWTAGHCLAENATWSYNVSFVPAYSDGWAPYGTWYAKNLTTKSDWFNKSLRAYDVGAATMNVNFGYRIADYLGAQGMTWNQSANYSASAFGYPAAAPYDGQYLWRADASTTDAGNGTIYMYSGLTGGSSGGPWLRNFDGSWGYVNGHNDFIYTANPSWMYSPYYGDQVAGLFNTVRYETTIMSLTPATPTISGTAKVGATLTATPGTWEPAPVTLTYQWMADGNAISGATATTLIVPPEAMGKTITLIVTGSRTGYTTISETSEATTTVAAGTLTGVIPKIHGTAKVGATLTSNPGTWEPAPLALTYQWMANGTAIPAATATTFTVPPEAKSKTITLEVTGSRAGYTTISKTSKATKKVAAGTLTGVTPKITGAAKVGQVLTSVSGSWKPPDTTLSYQWYRNSSRIKGATAVTYTLVKADKGKKVSVKVTGRHAGYTTLTKTSAKTTKVKAQ